MQNSNINTSKEDTIGELIGQLTDKHSFIRDISRKFNKRIRTLKEVWFSESNGFSVPIVHLDEIIDLLEKEIAKQSLNN